MTAVVTQTELLRSKTVIQNDVMVRPYRRDYNWQEEYDDIQQDEGGITWHSLLSRELVKSRVAARQALSRHARAGLLHLYAWPGIYHLTMSQSPCTCQINAAKLDRLRSAREGMSTKEGDSMPSLHEIQGIQQNKEHPVCNDQVCNANTLRSRRYRERQKVKAGCHCRHYRGSVFHACDYCVSRGASGMVSARQVMLLDSRSLPRERRFLYGLVGKYFGDVGETGAFLDALAALPSSPLLIHHTDFSFYTDAPDDRELSAFGHGRNRMITDEITTADGTTITIQRYKKGKVLIKPNRTRSPISPKKLRDFMQEIRKLLPFNSPEIETWRICSTDVNFDLPTKETADRYNRVYVLGLPLVLYNKDMGGGLKVLRIELQINPGTTLYGEFLPQLIRAKNIITEACCTQ